MKLDEICLFVALVRIAISECMLLHQTEISVLRYYSTILRNTALAMKSGCSKLILGEDILPRHRMTRLSQLAGLQQDDIFWRVREDGEVVPQAGRLSVHSRSIIGSLESVIISYF